MTLSKVIALYKSKNIEAITRFESSIEFDKIQLSEIIEIPFAGNYQLDSVSSVDKSASSVTFLFRVFKELEYVPSEEYPDYKVQTYPFETMMDELSCNESNHFLNTNTPRNNNNNISVLKLKEKDELTFLIETDTNYIFISETYWKS